MENRLNMKFRSIPDAQSAITWIAPVIQLSPYIKQQQGSLYILPWHFLHRGKTNDFTRRLANEAKCISWDDLKELVDFMYLAVHGRYAEDGTLQGFLEVLGIPYLGSGIFSSALCMDKVVQKNILKNAGIAVPRGIAIDPHQLKNFLKIRTKLHRCLSVRTLKLLLLSNQVVKVQVLVSVWFMIQKELFKAILSASSINRHHAQSVLVEEKITGMEFSCIIINDYLTNTLIPMPPTEIAQMEQDQIFDYEQKYMPGAALEYTPARCSQEDIKKFKKHVYPVTKAA